MKIELYRNLSDKKEYIEAEDGKTLKAILPELDWKQYMVLVNGKYTDDVQTVIHDGDFVIIRCVPHDLVTAGIIIGAVSLVAGVVCGIVGGVQAYNQKKETQRIQDELDSLSSSSSSTSKQTVTELPYIKGASNSVSIGKTQPYIIGKHLFTPYILNGGKGSYKGFHSISGKNGVDQYYNVVLEGGFNNQIIDTVSAGSMDILTCDGTEPQEGIYHTQAMTAFANEDSFIEFAQDGEDFETEEFNQKIVEVEKNDTLAQSNEDNYANLIYSLEDNAMGADVGIMLNGLVHYNSSGGKENKTRTIYPEYSLDYNQKIAEGDEDAEANATWVTFPDLFEVPTHVPDSYTYVTGVYKYTATGVAWNEVNDGDYSLSQEQLKERILKNPNKWSFQSGTDVRSLDWQITEWSNFSSKTTGGRRLGKITYTVTFKASKVTKTAGYDTIVKTAAISGKYTTQVRYKAHVDFAFADLFEYTTTTDEDTGTTSSQWTRKSSYPIAVRLRDASTKASSGSDVCTAYCQWIHSYCYNEDETMAQDSSAASFVKERIIGEREAALSTLIGVHIKATDENEESLGSIQVISSGVARTWDADAKAWSTEKTATSNPAAWYLEVLTSDKHAPSRITADEEESEIDLEALGEWSEYCDKLGYTVNYVVTEGMTKANLLEMILTCGRGVSYRNIYGQISIAIDKEIDGAIGILNEQNIISLEYNRDNSRSPDGLKVSYIDEEAGYQSDSLIVMYNQYDSDGNFDPYGKNRSADCTLKEVEATGMTSWFKAYRYALYLMRCEKLRPKTVTVQVGQEGIFYSPMAKILLQHPAFKIGLGSAEIKGTIVVDGYITGLELYDAVTLDIEHTFNVIMQCTSSSYNTPLTAELAVSEAGRTKEIYFATPIAETASVRPYAGNILSYGYEVSTVTSPMLISSVEPSDSGFTLTLIDYNASIFDMGTEIDEYHPNLTQPQDVAEVPSDLPSASLDELYSAVNGITEGTAEVGDPDVPVFTAYAVKDGITLTCEPFGEGLKNNIAKIMWYMKKEEDEDWTLLTSSGDKSFTYSFDRNSDGYPEKADFEGWLFKCVAYNGSGNHSESAETTVNTTKYGTWELTEPSILTRVSDRTISLIMSESARSDTLETYGTIKYKVQVRKPSVDAEGTFYKPATSADPYTSEDNYKDGEGYVTSEGVYTQTMPLTGQSSDSIVDTAYQFQITAYNEVNESTAVVVNATAVCTSIRDLVKANETAKESYIENLTALCSAFGFISGGLVDGKLTDALNYWALNSGLVDNDDNNRAYKGAFRVGGDDEFLLVKPVVTDGEVTGYSIDFKVGNFNVTSQASLFEGEFNVQDANSVFDRVKISPTGIFLQHRDSKAGAWYTVNQFDTSGVIAPSMRSNSQLIMGNFSQTVLRKAGHDIGRPYLTDEGVVYHFDDDIYNQNGTSGGMTLTGSYALKGSEDSAGIDFTPAIYAVAPYCTNAKCCYGQYRLDFPVSEATLLTVDFWEQYLYAEAQELFNIGTTNDKLKLEVLPSEPLAVTSGVCSWVYNVSNYLYTSKRNPSVGDYVYTSTSYAEIAGESDLTVEAVTLNEDYTVASITIGGNVYGFESGSAEMNWETFAPEEEWGEDSCIACRANNKKTLITHVGQASSEEIYLSDLDETFDEYEWEHIGVVFTDSKIKFLFNKVSYEFTRYSTASADFDISLNGSKTSVILDEVYIDTAVELTADFIAQTSNRVPWAKLDKDKNWMIVDAVDPSLFKSNVFDYKMSQMLNSDELKSVIQSVIDAQ